MLTQTYRPGAYHEFYLYEPKKRMISAAPYRARVVHHALCNVIEPIFERTFIFDSYACRVGKGTHRAVNRFTQHRDVAARAVVADRVPDDVASDAAAPTQRASRFRR